MKSWRLKILPGLVLFLTGVASAWAQSNISGTWTVVEGRMGAEEWEPYDNGWTLIIEQDVSALSVTEIIGDRENELPYLLDGSESRNEAIVSGGVVETYISHARWIAGALVIETATTRPTGSYTERRMYYRDIRGRLNVSYLTSDIRSEEVMLIWTIAYEKPS